MSQALVVDAAQPARWRPVLLRILRRRSALVSLLVLLLVLACALEPALLAPQDPMAQDLARRLRPPSPMPRGIPGFYLGTDQLGRDLLSRIMLGARITLLISVCAVAVAASVGIAAGLASGFLGGAADAVILRLIDMQLAFPLILLVIAIVSVVGPSLPNLILIMGLSGWPRFARVVRGSVLSLRGLEFVEAARSIGAGRLRIMLRHVLPNVLSAIIVYASFELARMILLEATLSFLGLGVQPPTPSWGGMIDDGRKYLALSWTVSLWPGLAIAALIMAINTLGDQLRDTLDPHLADKLIRRSRPCGCSKSSSGPTGTIRVEVDGFVAGIIVPFYVLEIDRLAHVRPLVVEFAREGPQIRIIHQAAQVALEVAVIDRVESHQRREQTPIGFGNAGTAEITLAPEHSLEPIKGREQR